MVGDFEPIEPSEPIDPEPAPIEVVPGPSPTRPPLDRPSSNPLKKQDIPPTPTIEPDSELEPIGDASGGDNKPPKGPPTGVSGDAADSEDDPEDDDDSDDQPNDGQGDPDGNPLPPWWKPPKYAPPLPPNPPSRGGENVDESPTKSVPQSFQRAQLRVAQCVFKPVDSISQYNSFRCGNSRHYRGRPFGIDVSLDGYSCYVATLRAEHPNCREEEYRKAAWNFIWNHQRFHYRVDCAIFALERAFDIAGRPLSSSVWQQFHNLVGGSPNRCSALEESLSCAFALRQCKEKTSHNLTLTLVRKQPMAYQQQTDDGEYILTTGGDREYQVATSQLLSRYLDLKLKSPYHAENLHLLLGARNPFGWPLRPYLAR